MDRFWTAFGAVAPVAIGAAAWELSGSWPVLDPLVVGLAGGVVAGLLSGSREAPRAGYRAALRVLLPAGIILYGTRVRLDRLNLVSVYACVQVFTGTIGAYLAAVWSARLLGLREKTALLLFAGTAVCGASAIAVAAPAVRAEDRDYSLSVLGVTVWGVVGMLVYPVLLRRAGMSDTAYALLAGTTLSMTGFVRSAASAAGPACVALAMAVKALRTASLVVIVPLLRMRSEVEGPGSVGPSGTRALFGGFAAVALASSFVPALAAARDAVDPYSALVLSMMMAAVGALTDPAEVLPSLPLGVAAGFAAWTAVIAAFAGGFYFFGY